MGSTTDRKTLWQPIVRAAPWIGVLVLIGGAVIMAVRLGVAATVLWFAFAALAGAMLLFWEALRSVIDPEAGGADADQAAIVAGEIGDLERRKKSALKALRDLEFEHSIGRLSDEDHRVLREKYRGEAREAMGAIDESLGNFLTEAEALVAKTVSETEKLQEKARESKAAGDEGDDEGDDEDDADDDDSADDADDEDADDEDEGGPDAVPAASAESTKTTESGTSAEPRASDEGEKVRAEVSPGDAAMPPLSKAEALRCPSCQTLNDADAVFCKKCASRLQESAS